MGPRARARGNAGGWCNNHPPVKLQWGHERALVEIGWALRLRRTTRRLQWGHERALVEIDAHTQPALCARASMGPRARASRNRTTQPPTSARADSCNGATSARSWKSCGLWLSWVHLDGFNGATSARSWKSFDPSHRANCVFASMGPRARARGNGGASGGGASIGLADR